MRGEFPPNVAMVTDLFTIHIILPDDDGCAHNTVNFKILLYQSLAMYKNH